MVGSRNIMDGIGVAEVLLWEVIDLHVWVVNGASGEVFLSL